MSTGVCFTDLASELLARFSDVATRDVDKEVDRALERLIGFLGTDRSGLAEINPENGVVTVTHSVARQGVASGRIGTRLTELRWGLPRLQQGKTNRFNRLPDEFPNDALAERSLANSLPMLSHIAVPLQIGGHWIGAFGTSTATGYRAWTDDDVARIQIVGRILANAIHRRNLETTLQKRLTDGHRQGRLEAENWYLRESIKGSAGFDAFEELAGKSLPLRRALDLAARVAVTSTPVLILGETGTGKELVARAIHAHSKRSERAMTRVNCAALPTSLIESELFGHEKGAFTGAASAKLGRFELADGGTLFLDEVGELAPEAQAKLLRILETGEFERVGATRTRKVDVRVVAATNRDLEREMVKGHFREDLYYRLSPFPIHLPALRHRKEDIPLLVWDLIHRRQTELGRRIERVPESVMQALMRYSWPGNIRELGNVIERSLILSTGDEFLLDTALRDHLEPAQPGESLREVERAHFLRVLEACHWRFTGPGNAAKILGLNPSTLRFRLKKLGIRRPDSSL